MKAIARILFVSLFAALLLNAQQGPPVNQVNFQAGSPPPVTIGTAQLQGNPGNAQYCYWVVANYPIGPATLSPGFCLSNAPNVLTGSAYVLVTWSPVSSAVSYDILRTTTTAFPSSGSCTCALITGTTSTTFADQGGSLASYTLGRTPAAQANITLDNQNYSVPQLVVSLPGIAPFPIPGSGNIPLTGLQLTISSPVNVQNSIALAGPTSLSPLLSPFFGLQVNEFNMPTNLGAASGLAWPNGAIGAFVDVPASASGAGSVGQGFAAITAYCREKGSFAWPGNGGSACAGLRIETFNAATNGSEWGITIQGNDSDRTYANPGAQVFAASGVTDIEADLVINSASTQRAANFFVVKNGAAQGVQYDAGMLMESELGSICGVTQSLPCLAWKYPIQIVGGSATNAGIIIGEYSLTANSNSMGIQLIGRDSTNTPRVGSFSVDGNGAPILTAANNGSNTTCAFTLGKSGTSANLACVDSLGALETSGKVYSQSNLVNKTDATNVTWSASDILFTMIDEVASATITVTLPTAASIISAITANGLTCETNQSFQTNIRNLGGTTITLQGNTGLTVSSASAGSTITIPGGSNTVLLSIISSCGANTISTFENSTTGSISVPLSANVLGSNGSGQLVAANSVSVRNLWTGTCNNTSVMRGDGACASAIAGGWTAVHFVGLQATGAPTIGSGACGAGSNGTVSANSTDFGAIITVGAAATTSCALNFNSPYISAPACTVSSTSPIASQTVTPGPSSVTIGGTSLANNTLLLICVGQKGG